MHIFLLTSPSFNITLTQKTTTEDAVFDPFVHWQTLHDLYCHIHVSCLIQVILYHCMILTVFQVAFLCIYHIQQHPPLFLSVLKEDRKYNWVNLSFLSHPYSEHFMYYSTCVHSVIYPKIKQALQHINTIKGAVVAKS